MAKASRKKRHDFIYGLELEVLGGDGQTLALAEKHAAHTAVRAWEARTWGEFAQVAGCSLDDLLDGWGEEIKEVCGRTPSTEDAFSFGDYRGLFYFADLIDDPRQAAFDAVIKSRDLTHALRDAGFEFHGSPCPGFPGVEGISFTDPAQAERVASVTGLSVERDRALPLRDGIASEDRPRTPTPARRR